MSIALSALTAASSDRNFLRRAGNSSLPTRPRPITNAGFEPTPIAISGILSLARSRCIFTRPGRLARLRARSKLAPSRSAPWGSAVMTAVLPANIAGRASAKRDTEPRKRGADRAAAHRSATSRCRSHKPDTTPRRRRPPPPCR